MRFILHVWTKDPKNKPWCVHFDGGDPIQYRQVFIDVPTMTRAEGHTPCANWYITGTYRSIHEEGDIVKIS